LTLLKRKSFSFWIDFSNLHRQIRRKAIAVVCRLSHDNLLSFFFTWLTFIRVTRKRRFTAQTVYRRMVLGCLCLAFDVWKTGVHRDGDSAVRGVRLVQKVEKITMLKIFAMWNECVQGRIQQQKVFGRMVRRWDNMQQRWFMFQFIVIFRHWVNQALVLRDLHFIAVRSQTRYRFRSKLIVLRGWGLCCFSKRSKRRTVVKLQREWFKIRAATILAALHELVVQAKTRRLQSSNFLFRQEQGAERLALHDSHGTPGTSNAADTPQVPSWS